MSKLLIIDNCLMCGWVRDEGWQTPYYCGHEKAEGPGDNDACWKVDGTSIPDWCPLEEAEDVS